MFSTAQVDRSWADWPPVRNVEEAYAFLDAMGVCLFHRKSRVAMPALSDVLAEEPEWAGHPMVWKDLLHEARRVYYGTVVRGDTSFVMPELLPAFYRLQGMDAGAYLEAYDRGVVATAAVRVLRALLDEGPLSTRQLRRVAGLAGAGQKPAFAAATHTLMRTLTVTVVASKSRQLPGYEYVWDVFARLWPEVSEAAVVRYPDAAGAITAVAERCAAWLDGTAEPAQLFGWEPIAPPQPNPVRTT